MLRIPPTPAGANATVPAETQSIDVCLVRLGKKGRCRKPLSLELMNRLKVQVEKAIPHLPSGSTYTLKAMGDCVDGLLERGEEE